MDARWTKARDRQDRRMRRSQPSQPALRSETVGVTQARLRACLQKRSRAISGPGVGLESATNGLTVHSDTSQQFPTSRENACVAQTSGNRATQHLAASRANSGRIRDTLRNPKLCLRFHRSLLMRGAEEIQAFDTLAASQDQRASLTWEDLENGALAREFVTC